MGKFFKMALWKQIVIAIILGGLIGKFFPAAVPVLKPFGDIFLRLLKMLIAPLVLFTLTSGVCKMGDIHQLRRVGVRIVAFYVLTSTFAAALGMGFAMITQPGQGVTDLLTTGKAAKAVSYSFIDNAIQWIPTNIFESLAKGNTLQIIVFAIFSGVVLLALGEPYKGFVELIDKAAGVMLKMTDYVMKYSPIGILALVADMVNSLSGKMMAQVLNFIATDWAACLVIIFIVQPLLVRLLAKQSMMKYLKNIMPCMVVAASTTSSAATLPLELKIAHDKLGVPEKIYGFCLPLGNTCNMNGMAVAIGCISIFASNLFNVPVTLGSCVQFVFLGLVLSIGAAGVKGAGIVMSSVLLQTLGYPLTLVPILAAIWPIIDIPHTTANVSGDLAGTIVVAKSMDMLDEELFNS
jgi:Na+/H+-dicarboxylate symporter